MRQKRDRGFYALFLGCSWGRGGGGFSLFLECSVIKKRGTSAMGIYGLNRLAFSSQVQKDNDFVDLYFYQAFTSLCTSL